MSDVTAEQTVDLDRGDGAEAPVSAAGLDAVDEQLIAQLAGRARAGGLALTGEGGLLAQLTKRLVESALEGEITDLWVPETIHTARDLLLRRRPATGMIRRWRSA